jgi:hypothetical protein
MDGQQNFLAKWTRCVVVDQIRLPRAQIPTNHAGHSALVRPPRKQAQAPPIRVLRLEVRKVESVNANLAVPIDPASVRLAVCILSAKYPHFVAAFCERPAQILYDDGRASPVIRRICLREVQ